PRPPTPTPSPPPPPVTGCSPSTALPQSLDPDPLVLGDNFEGGTFSSWTSVTAEGDARAVVDWPTAETGTCGGHFTISSSSTSRANITRSLPALITDVWADGWFYESGEGLANSNVGFFRFFDGSNRIADVYRQNITGGYWLR